MSRTSETLTASIHIPFPEYDSPPPDPLPLLQQWLDTAHTHRIREPRALALATADVHGNTSIRTVALTQLTPTGLIFTTHNNSRKGHELLNRPWASALLYWRETSQQISVNGPAHPCSTTVTHAQWAARPHYTHAMTIASRQSQPLQDPETLLSTARALSESAPHPPPPHYSAYELTPHTIEFWADGHDRLHQRLHYQQTPTGWTHTRLQP
jgi:pyridoxamine 5'-phosphate oxidase